ncbi:MAG: ion transporter [Sneathiella sp.]|jgi:voltage-gated potassium channel|uniref:potassium channel family protein n=1 Tax=Sneathiella sp. TaxID=1964365 RepID=UPI000C5F71DF|nr:potassium channel family protein [Sneathiella sp.]MAL78409.1 ion transporter [Sneathiella sp.]|tara:strand:+ start:694 stop:1473 length:780 start_codon:yes stop_codon:yes gene_type:complete
MPGNAHFSAEKINVFQLLILVLSLFSVGSLLAESFLSLDAGTVEILMTADFIICFVFLYDFFKRLFDAENKLAFMKWGWIDLISSIPVFDVLRYGRLVRVVRVLRVLRVFTSGRILYSTLKENKVETTFNSVVLVSMMVLIFGAISVLHLERGVADSNIKEPMDALWWAFVTITTVGYGDYYPVTAEGRFIAILLMTNGIGFFATLSAMIASKFIRENKTERQQEQILRMMYKLEADLTDIRREINSREMQNDRMLSDE